MHAVLEDVKKCRLRYQYTAMVSLDIAGVFDHVSWPHTLKELSRKGVNKGIVSIVKDYLTERVITDDESCQRRKALRCGCPQVSVLGPLLWNIGYDCVLDGLAEQQLIHYAYADDTLIVVCANTRDELV